MPFIAYLITCLLLSTYFLSANECECVSGELDYSPLCISDHSPNFIKNLPVICDKTWTLSVRLAHYSPTTQKAKKIYSDAWLDYEVEASKRFNRYMSGWVSVAWAGKRHGHHEPLRRGFEDKTKMYVLPISLGASVMFPVLSCLDLYVGAGVSYSFLDIQNRLEEYKYSYESYYPYDYYYGYYDYSYEYYRRERVYEGTLYKQSIQKSAWGSLFKTGLHYKLGSYMFIDVFADYYYQYFKFKNHHHHSKYEIFFKDYLNCSGYKIGAGLGVYF